MCVCVQMAADEALKAGIGVPPADDADVGKPPPREEEPPAPTPEEAAKEAARARKKADEENTLRDIQRKR